MDRTRIRRVIGCWEGTSSCVGGGGGVCTDDISLHDDAPREAAIVGSQGVRHSVSSRQVKMSSQVAKSRRSPPPAGPALVPHALTTPLGWGTSVAFSQLTTLVLIAGPHCPWV